MDRTPLPPGITLIPLGELKPHEAVKEKKAHQYAKFATRAKKVLTKPILVDERTKVILDGHHRWWVLKSLGVALAPCCCVDYLGDATIQVLPRRPDIPVTKESVIEMGLSGGTYPHKTTKHVYAIPAMDRLVNLKASW
jgi:ParB-like chromosome segregation protein Spo0J